MGYFLEFPGINLLCFTSSFGYDFLKYLDLWPMRTRYVYSGNISNGRVGHSRYIAKINPMFNREADLGGAVCG